METSSSQGPGERILGTGKRILTLLVGMVETRLQLAVVELEEEKARLFQLLLLLCLTLLFVLFGLASLLVLIIWVIDPHYRLYALIITTFILLILALFTGILAWRKSRASTLLCQTRKELEKDRQSLEGNVR